MNFNATKEFLPHLIPRESNAIIKIRSLKHIVISDEEIELSPWVFNLDIMA